MTKQEIKDKYQQQLKEFCDRQLCDQCKNKDLYYCTEEFLLDIIADLTIKFDFKEEKSKEMLDALIEMYEVGESSWIKSIIEKYTGQPIEEVVKG